MSAEFAFSREELDKYLKELGREFRRLNGKNAHAEVVLIGGASVLINYEFREMTGDADAVIYTNAAMKDAINRVRDNNSLPDDWLSEDFKKTTSYTEKLRGVSVHYRTFSNILHIRTITAEYLIAMKVMSGRQYKFDLSDIVGILWEHEKNGCPICRVTVENAVTELYGQDSLPEISSRLLDILFSGNVDYERLFTQTREREKETREVLFEFLAANPDALKKDNINDVIAHARKQKHLD